MVALVAAGVRDVAVTGSLTRSLPILVGALAVVAAMLGVLFLPPLGRELKHLRVDARGLMMGPSLLPAEQVRRIAVLSEAEAVAAAYRLRHQGTRAGWTHVSYGLATHDGPAVWVEQDSGRRPGWLIATRDPDGLRAALEQVRRLHR